MPGVCKIPGAVSVEAANEETRTMDFGMNVTTQQIVDYIKADEYKHELAPYGYSLAVQLTKIRAMTYGYKAEHVRGWTVYRDTDAGAFWAFNKLTYVCSCKGLPKSLFVANNEIVF